MQRVRKGLPKKTSKKAAPFLLAFMAAALASGCASLPPPGELVSPTPIQGNTGRYMSPYTSDAVLAEWVDKALNAKIGSTIGKTVGAYAGQKAFDDTPLLGAILGASIGGEIGRNLAIEASGGWEFIRETSDLSFNSLDNMSVYLYVNHSSHDHFNEAMNATFEIYPELKDRYFYAIKRARRKR